MNEPHKHDGGLLVMTPGAHMTVQDLGRPGLAHLGVTRSGAADVAAHSHANALVGNDGGGAGAAGKELVGNGPGASEPGAATLEVTGGGCEIRALEDVLLAVTGAHTPMWVGSVPAPFGSPVRLRAGQTLELGVPKHGLRNYIAVRGGINVARVLGSRATDVLSGLGPDPVAANSHLLIGPAAPVDQAGFDALRRLAISAHAPQRDMSAESEQNSALLFRQQAPGGTTHVLRVRLGPRDDWFTQAAIDTLLSESYEVSQDSNRVGVRLSGPVLERARDGELESEGLVVGAVQVPASGQPVVFLADHPVTGGYPVVAVVEPEDLPLVAQARPGDRVHFQQVTRQVE